MVMTEPTSWVQKLVQGTLDIGDPATFEKLPFVDLIKPFQVHFPYQFLCHRIKQKVEIGLAKTFRRSRPSGTKKQETSRNGAARLTDQHFYDCVFLTGEFGLLTGFAKMPEIHFRHVAKSAGSMAIASGGGINLYRDIDGWKITFTEGRVVTLTKEFLTKRGWLQQGPELLNVSDE